MDQLQCTRSVVGCMTSSPFMIVMHCAEMFMCLIEEHAHTHEHTHIYSHIPT